MNTNEIIEYVLNNPKNHFYWDYYVEANALSEKNNMTSEERNHILSVVRERFLSKK